MHTTELEISHKYFLTKFDFSDEFGGYVNDIVDELNNIIKYKLQDYFEITIVKITETSASAIFDCDEHQNITNKKQLEFLDNSVGRNLDYARIPHYDLRNNFYNYISDDLAVKIAPYDE